MYVFTCELFLPILQWLNFFILSVDLCDVYKASDFCRTLHVHFSVNKACSLNSVN